MAVASGIPGSGKRPSYTGNITTYVRNGRLIYAKYRKKSGKPKSQITRDQNEWFRQANLLAKYAPSDDQWMVIEVAKGGPWYPRDLLMSAMRGRLFEVLIIDGQEYRAVAVVEDVSSDLDFVAGTVEGTLLVRGASLWQALVPTTAGHVLTSNGADTLPSYQAGGGGGGASLATQFPLTSYSGSAYAWKGFNFIADRTFNITNLSAIINATSGHKYRGSVIEYNAGLTIDAIVQTTAEITSGVTTRLVLQEPLGATALIEEGKRYMIGWSRTDGTDTFGFPLALAKAATMFQGIPARWFALASTVETAGRVAKAVPAIGDTVNESSGAQFFMACTIEL